MATTERKYDLYGPEFRADPACVFAQMREHDPVLCQPGLDGETPIWFITRHDDVAAVLLDDERFVRDPRNALSAGGDRGARRDDFRWLSRRSRTTCSTATATTTGVCGGW